MTLVHRLNSLRQMTLQDHDVVLIDRKLMRFPVVKKWLASAAVVYPVTAGESLKQLSSFPKHMENLLRKTQNLSLSQLRFVVVGGGSVGDWGGFIASTFKRGVGLVHIPSTWLAAIDSSHGGKTALNVGNFKNQMGSFYPAEHVYLCKDLLFLQPDHLAVDAFGELLKTFALDSVLAKSSLLQKQATSEVVWDFLIKAIHYKYKVVKSDPYEKKGIRSLLNLGHTLGHAFEKSLHWPHGKSVLYGLAFDLFWSEEKGYLSERELVKIVSSPLWKELFDFQEYAKALSISSKKIRSLILQDKKKISSSQLRQVFLRRAGQALVAPVTFKEVLAEYERQQSYFH